MASASLSAWARALDGPESGSPRRLPYRTYRDTWLRLAALAERGCENGSALAATVRGESRGGEPIWAFDLAPDRPARATTFVVAGLHAMEHVGVATAVALLERAAAPGSPWRGHRLVVIPMANPDGFLAVERGLARGDRRFRRANAAGVDLNRNFEVGWDPGYYLGRLLRRVFWPGPAPLSEPETQAVDRLVAEVRPRHAVSLHAFGEWIFLPYAGSRRAPPDLDRMMGVARGMAAAQPMRAYRILPLGIRSRLFQARGAEIDHFYERHGALSFLLEIGAGPRLRHPSTWLLPYGWFTPPAALLERDVANALPAIEFLASLDG